MLLKATEILRMIEEYLDRFNVRGESIEVFINPSRKERRDLNVEFIRFFADDDNKKVYVWKGFSAVHGEMMWHLSLNGKDRSYPPASGSRVDPFYSNLLVGIAQPMGGGSIEMIDSIPIHRFLDYLRPEDRDEKETKTFRNLMSKDWRWLDKYIDASKYLKRVKEEFEDIVNDKSTQER